jgi:hypothetical protein
MTEKQADKLRQKTKKIKNALAADKKFHGGYFDDSNGLRYLPPALYLKLGDYKGGLNYFRWFHKNFPDDIGYPDFLFEWTIILFYSEKLKEAEKMAFRTFCANTYIIDKFFGRPILPLNKYESSNLESPDFTDHFLYHAGQPELEGFTTWLGNLTQSEKFVKSSHKFIAIKKQLQTENDTETRHFLIEQVHLLNESF